VTIEIIESSAVKMLPVPRVSDLGREWRDGILCVWCGAAPSVALGPRTGVVHGVTTEFFPRACRPCVTREAMRVARIHTRNCDRCTRTRQECPDSRTLYRLAQTGATP
jgi:hypothetical protein